MRHRIRSLKYAAPFLIYALALLSFHERGWVIPLPLMAIWMLVPLWELMMRPDPQNLAAAEEEMARHDRTYDIWLYLVAPMQYVALWHFLDAVQEPGLQGWELAGRIFVMGLLCGAFGINVAHELGHRHGRFERTLSRLLLLTSLYMHFYIEHNRGHHKRVSTPEDPASARYGETVYAFYLRSVRDSWRSAWRIAASDMRKAGLPVLHPRNEMLQYQLLQAAFLSILLLSFGPLPTACFLAAATLGFLMLETVNYIEHYGLQRKPTGKGAYERPQPHHSWNSSHVVGRLLLFELSRHSDHHYQASRKYQVLRHHDGAPQMPTGYPGMMILSLMPPLWFRVMDPRIGRQDDPSLRAEAEAEAAQRMPSAPK